MSVEDIHQHTDVPSEPSARFTCHLDGPVAVVTMNYRPYNLMNLEFTEQLIEALGWVRGSGARAAILRSGLRHFSAGADLDGMLEAVGDGEGTLGWPILEMLQAFDELPIPAQNEIRAKRGEAAVVFESAQNRHSRYTRGIGCSRA